MAGQGVNRWRLLRYLGALFNPQCDGAVPAFSVLSFALAYAPDLKSVSAITGWKTFYLEAHIKGVKPSLSLTSIAAPPIRSVLMIPGLDCSAAARINEVTPSSSLASISVPVFRSASIASGFAVGSKTSTIRNFPFDRRAGSIPTPLALHLALVHIIKRYDHCNMSTQYCLSRSSRTMSCRVLPRIVRWQIVPAFSIRRDSFACSVVSESCYTGGSPRCQPSRSPAGCDTSRHRQKAGSPRDTLPRNGNNAPQSTLMRCEIRATFSASVNRAPTRACSVTGR